LCQQVISGWTMMLSSGWPAMISSLVHDAAVQVETEGFEAEQDFETFAFVAQESEDDEWLSSMEIVSEMTKFLKELLNLATSLSCTNSGNSTSQSGFVRRNHLALNAVIMQA
jgi:hypothetical protein